MKIYSQDGTGIYEFGSVWIGKHPTYSIICGRSYSEENAVILGTYSDIARARGVLFDIDTAYQKGKSIFYMPGR